MKNGLHCRGARARADSQAGLRLLRPVANQVVAAADPKWPARIQTVIVWQRRWHRYARVSEFECLDVMGPLTREKVPS